MQTYSMSRIIQIFTIAVTLAISSLASAEPSLQDVNHALQGGDIAKADTLMKEVISANPNSAKAHFKYSEILAAEGRLSDAKIELAQAEKLQPGLAFVKPEALSAFKHKLYNTSGTTNSVSTNPSNPFLKWAGIAFVVFLIVMIFRAFRRPQIQPNYVQPNYANNPQAPNNYGPQGSYGPQGGYAPQQGGGMGSGILGGLATGAAVGAGIVAGEMVMHKILDGDHSNTDNSNSSHNQTTSNDFSDISGNEFTDADNGSWDNNSSMSDSSSFDSDNSGDWS